MIRLQWGVHRTDHSRLWVADIVPGDLYEGQADPGEVDHVSEASRPGGSLSRLESADRGCEGPEEEEEDLQRGGGEGEEAAEEENQNLPSQQEDVGVLLPGQLQAEHKSTCFSGGEN